MEMLAWAALAVVTGHAPATMRGAADEAKGNIAQGSALAVLRLLVPVMDGSAARATTG